MSLVIVNDNLLRLDIPNSEAIIIAQHNGTVNKSVGGYYISEKKAEVIDFFNNFVGNFVVDVSTCVFNINKIIEFLLENRYQKAFKKNLIPQKSQVQAFKWLLEQKDFLHSIQAPSLNDSEKYLRFDNNDPFITGLRTLIIGDLVSLYCQKIGDNVFIFYVDRSPYFETILKQNKILSWMN